MDKFEELPELPKEISEAAWKKAKSTFRKSKESGMGKLLVKTEKAYYTIKSRQLFTIINEFYTELYDKWNDIKNVEEPHIHRLEHNLKYHENWEHLILDNFVKDCLHEIKKSCDELLDQHGNSKAARLVQKSMLSYLADLKKACTDLENEFPSKDDFKTYSENIEELEKEMLNGKTFLKMAMNNMVNKFLKKQAKERIAILKEVFTGLDQTGIDAKEAAQLSKSGSENIHHIFRSGGIQLRQYFKNKQSKDEALALLDDTDIENRAKELFDISAQKSRGSDSGYLEAFFNAELEEGDYKAVSRIIDAEFKEALSFLKSIVALVKDIKKEYDELN